MFAAAQSVLVAEGTIAITIHGNESPHLLIWIAGIAVILFSAAGMAAIMGWIPTSILWRRLHSATRAVRTEAGRGESAARLGANRCG
jgi:hypothetical protein